MPVTVVVGGQFGGEGKGKVAYLLAKEMGAQVSIRVGGTNSGHTVVAQSGTPIILRQLPTAALLPDVTCVLGAGSYIDPDILFEEISLAGLSSDRLIIDPNAVIITEKDRQTEKSSTLRDSIGSTLSGTGGAVQNRISRKTDTILAKHHERLRCFVKPTVSYLRKMLNCGTRVIIEGTQGFGLSLLHSDFYPFVTSRDTTAAAFVSEAGLSPLDVDDVVLVIRANPIRVAGNSGPLPNEIDWETVTRESGAGDRLVEHTSVTKTVRRVGRFDPDIVIKAIEANQPTRIVLNHLDYIDVSCKHLNRKTDIVAEFVGKIESLLEKRIDSIGFSPSSIVTHMKATKKLNIA